MTVMGGRTVYELRGVPCMPLELVELTRKGIALTRSFGTRSRPSWRGVKRWPATPPAQRKRCAGTRWQPTTCSSLHTNALINALFYSNGASTRFPRHDERYRRGGRSRGTLGRTSLPRRLPLCEVRRDDLGAATRDGPAAGPVERARPRTKGAGLADSGPAQRHAGAGTVRTTRWEELPRAKAK